MSQVVLHAYTYGENALALRCTPTNAEFETTPSGSILLLEAPPDQLELAVDIQMARDTLDVVLPQDDRGDPTWSVGVLARSSVSRFRIAKALEPGTDEGFFVGSLVLTMSDLRGSIELVPVLVRNVARGSMERYGTHVGAALAGGTSVDVLLEQPVAPPGGYLDIEFEDFRESASPLRRGNSDRLFALDLDGESPKMWLNRGVEDFGQIMRSNARRGAVRRFAMPRTTPSVVRHGQR